MKIDPFASKFIESRVEPRAFETVKVTQNLIESFRKKAKSVKGGKSRTRSVKSFATMEDTWS